MFDATTLQMPRPGLLMPQNLSVQKWLWGSAQQKRPRMSTTGLHSYDRTTIARCWKVETDRRLPRSSTGCRASSHNLERGEVRMLVSWDLDLVSVILPSAMMCSPYWFLEKEVRVRWTSHWTAQEVVACWKNDTRWVSTQPLKSYRWLTVG